MPAMLPLPACPAGCDVCCRLSLTVFPVEAFYLRSALLRLPAAGRRLLAERRKHPDPETCLLLVDHRCLLYPYRPIICRTHGYLFLGRGGEGPEGWEIFPGCEHARQDRTRPAQEKPSRVSALLIDPINEMLVAVNRLFLQEGGLRGGSPPVRIPIAEVPSLGPPGGDAHASV